MKTQTKILMTLNDFGRLATSRIAGIIGIDHNFCLKNLNKLENEDLVYKTSIDNLNYIYWEITKKGLLLLKKGEKEVNNK